MMDWTWLESDDARLYIDFPTSIAMGVLIGLERRELLSIVQFAALTFIILPFLPDRDFGP
jgi:hypothetical protein